MRFGIVVAKDIEKAQELGKKIKKYLEVKGQQIAGEKLESANLVLTLGGDGTLIHTACEHAHLDVPFIGINAGTLGFLTATEASDWEWAVENLIAGKYFVSERMTLDASIEKSGKAHPRGVLQVSPRLHPAGEGNGSYRALNEIVVKGMYRVIDLEILVNNQKFLSISGDGVIVATPTGSTAYSLSAGGSIVDPEIDCLLVTPINAVGLPIPSVVLSPEDVVEIKVTKGEDVSLIIDGQEHIKLESGSSSTKVTEGKQSVKVSKGRYRVKFGYFDKHHFLKALNAKFGLGSRGLKVKI